MEIEQLEFLNINKNFRVMLLDEMEYWESDNAKAFHEFFIKFRLMNIAEKVFEDEFGSMYEDFMLHIYLKDGLVQLGNEAELCLTLDSISYSTNDLELLASKMLNQKCFIELVESELEDLRDSLAVEEEDIEDEEINEKEVLRLKEGIKYFEEMLDIIQNKQERIKLSPEYKKEIARYRLNSLFK